VPMIEEAVVRQDVIPLNLLVVDDEQYVRQLCADVAVQSGMKVTTGAIQAKRGLLIAAQGGTLFLDKIGDMPVGSTERRQINVRIIAATNRDLEAAIRTGAFRQDLYFRLNVVQMKLPALRDRKSDIPLLVTSFLEKFSGMPGTTKTITDEAMQRLRLSL
jgi:DNA-binding NtrC family response regulator